MTVQVRVVLSLLVAAGTLFGPCARGTAQSFVEFPAGGQRGVGAAGLTTGPDGNLWFVGGDQVGRITPAGDVTLFSIPTRNSATYDITVGADDNLWFVERRGVGRITPEGTITEFAIPDPPGCGACCDNCYAPQGITSGPDGNLWYVSSYRNTVGRITPTGTVTEFPAAYWNLHDITSGPDGNLWFTEYYGKPGDEEGTAIGRITPAGTITDFPVSGRPLRITAGPDGNLWFVGDVGVARMTPTGTVTELSFPTMSHADDITAGPDGNLWVRACGVRYCPDAGDAGMIARITPTGTITEFPLPDPSCGYQGGITAGPDGNIWFPYHSGLMALNLSGTAAVCAPTPASGCRTARHNLLVVKANLARHEDKLSWRWSGGQSTSEIEFGDPPNTTGYALCMYTGSPETLLTEIDVPAGGNWRSASTTRFSYKSEWRNANVLKLLLRASDRSRAKIKAVVGWNTLSEDQRPHCPRLPSPGNIPLPVTMQLVNSTNSTCWEAVYDAADVIRNDAEYFKARSVVR